MMMFSFLCHFLFEMSYLKKSTDDEMTMTRWRWRWRDDDDDDDDEIEAKSWMDGFASERPSHPWIAPPNIILPPQRNGQELHSPASSSALDDNARSDVSRHNRRQILRGRVARFVIGVRTRNAQKKHQAPHCGVALHLVSISRPVARILCHVDALHHTTRRRWKIHCLA